MARQRRMKTMHCCARVSDEHPAATRLTRLIAQSTCERRPSARSETERTRRERRRTGNITIEKKQSKYPQNRAQSREISSRFVCFNHEHVLARARDAALIVNA